MKDKLHWNVYEPGIMAYHTAMMLQERLVTAKHENRANRDAFMLLEHFPVLTIGRRGGKENLLVDEDFLSNRNIEIVSTVRGGNITFHGPGQVVGYLVVDILSLGLDLRLFVERMEEILIRVAADFGVKGVRDNRNHGVWVGGEKLASVGLAVSRGVSFHGFALNVNNDLTPFQWINPCGLKGISMTSLLKIKNRPVDMGLIGKSVKTNVSKVFGATLVPVSEKDVDCQ